METVSWGIHQSDVIIRSAIIAGLADLKRNPYLLDYIFVGLPKDELTRNEYGSKEASNAKRWFLNTEIPVVVTPRIDEPSLPCITISLEDSSEDVTTLGDVHWITSENFNYWPIVGGPIFPVSYDGPTGKVTLEPGVIDSIPLAKGMVLVDKRNQTYPILEVQDQTALFIEAGQAVDLSGAVVKASGPYKIALEGANFRESYSIGCHVSGEAFYVAYLESIVKFLLLRYKETLLEKRGFERSTIQSSKVQINPATDHQMIISRYVSISGYIRHYWPKNTGQIIDAVTGSPNIISVIGGAEFPLEEISAEELLWTGDQDLFGNKP